MTREEAMVFLDNLKICINEHPVVADWLVEIADRKTESDSEKPNNCETCRHWWKSEDVCLLDDCHYEPKDEPQTCSVNGRPYDCGNCEYHKCTADEP